MGKFVKLSKKSINAFRVSYRDLRAAYGEKPLNMFKFSTTADVKPISGFIGQDRAIEALGFGLRTHTHGWNIFVVEPSGSGRSSTLKHALEELVPKSGFSEAQDIVCVYNFSEPEKPQFIRLGKGRARAFAKTIRELGNAIGKNFSSFIGSQQYWLEVINLEDAHPELGKLNAELKKDALETEVFGEIYFRFKVNYSNQSLPGMLIVMRVEDDVVINERDYAKMSKGDTEKIKQKSEEISSRCTTEWALRVARDMTIFVYQYEQSCMDKLFVFKASDILTEYGESVVPFMNGLHEYAVGNIDNFLPQQQGQDNGHLPFEVKVFVDNSDVDSVPVIVEDNPTYERLFGEVGHKQTGPGMFINDHTMVRAGSFIKANGGVLVLQAEELFQQPGVWERLISVLSSGTFDVSERPGMLSFLGSSGLSPERIKDVRVKVILVGSRWIYGQILHHPILMGEIDSLFRVIAEFDSTTPRTKKTTQEFVSLIRTFCDKEDLPHFDVPATISALNYASRLAGHREKFSLDIKSFKDIIVESAQWAKADGVNVVSEAHVQKALEKSVYRVSLVRDRMQDMFREGSIMIEIDGKRAGQLNALAVYGTGNLQFGLPCKVTAQTFVGGGGIVNIEGNAGLSGKFHRKSFDIIRGYIGMRYAQTFHPSFSATISFEQSYSELDGDSASLVQTYVILSSLSGVPLRQDIAVTGSMNQFGEVQPIGGVEHKIEGFFDICSARGLTGEQGVMIPAKNKPSLVLRNDIVEAVRDGRFHIWAICQMEEGLEILTGVKAGEVKGKIETGPRKGHDEYPEGTINCLVTDRLWELTRAGKRNNNKNDKTGNQQEEKNIDENDKD